MKKTIYLIDISSFIFRAFYGIRSLSNSKGEPTNAVYGVAQMLAQLFEKEKPEYCAVLYDSKEPSFREEIDPEYKANRSSPPEDLIPQFARVDQLVSAMKIPSFRLPGFEADDLIATVCEQWKTRGSDHEVVVVTGDKDLMQLVDERVKILDTMNNKEYREPDVVEKFGLPPHQILDYLGLVGDTSDNIPGVKGIGPKTAVALLTEWKTLDLVLEAASQGKISGKKGEVIHEHRENALRSRVLARLKSDVPIEHRESDFKFRFHFNEELRTFFTLLEFGKLIDRWERLSSEKMDSASETVALTQLASAPAPVSIPHSSAQDSYVSVTTIDDVKKILALIEKTHEFGFDLETTSLKAVEAEIVGIALAPDITTGYYIPVAHEGLGVIQCNLDEVLPLLKPYLENPKYKKIGQNLKYDISVLFKYGIHLEGIGVDTMVASYVIDPSGRHNLDTLCKKYLDYQVLTFEDVCGKGKNQIPFSHVPVERATRYSGEDALYAMKLSKRLIRELGENKLMPVFAEIDLPIVSLLAEMENEGVKIDVPYLKKLSIEFERDRLELEARVISFSENKALNLNSPKQLAVFLFEELKLPTQSKTKTGFSTDASVLEALASHHEAVKLLTEYREITKLKGTYIDPLPLMVSAKTGRIHAGFHQTVAATGRLSSSDPNLQNIPIKTKKGQLIRKAFIAEKGNLLLSSDYNQIELRILAHLSGDEELCRSFLSEEDVHRRTAAEIFHIAVDAVDDFQRGVAKAINFGLMYGKTAFGLAAELGISRTEARNMIENYFKRYSKVKQYLDSLIENAKDSGFTMTELGRKRQLPELASKNPMIRANGERMAMNTPIQGTAADLMKLSMVALEDALKNSNLKTKMIIQVHDEIVFELPAHEKDEASRLIQKTMEGAYRMKVRLKVSLNCGENWAEL